MRVGNPSRSTMPRSSLGGSPRGDLGKFGPVGGVCGEIVDDCTRCGNGLGIRGKAETGEFCNAKLLAQNSFGVIVLKNPIFETRFHTAGAIEQGSFRGLEKLPRAGQQRLARMQKLQLVAHVFVGARAGEFRGLKFASGEIDVSEAYWRAGRQ